MTELAGMPDKNVRVPYAMTVHGEEEIAAVVQVLRTSTQMGVHTREFEARCAAEFSKRHGVMVNSGSSALYLAVEALGLPEGSEVITPALTFSTTVGCIVKNKLVPVFIDVEPNTYCIDADKVEAMINDNTRAMVIPNLMGNLPDWDRLATLAEDYDLVTIEDSADIIGATYKGRKLGYHSDVTTTSFYGMHVINCAGNGGMVCVNDDDLADRIRLLRSWGRSSTRFVDSENIENRFNVSVDGVPYDAKFVFEQVGYNLEGSELGAAFGVVQHRKLPNALHSRKEVAAAQMEFFSNYGEWLDLPVQNTDADTTWFAFPMIVKEAAPFTRTDVQVFLEGRNIQTRVVFTGNITRQPGFRNVEMKVHPDGLGNTDRVMESSFLIASHHGMTEEMLAHTHETFQKFASQF